MSILKIVIPTHSLSRQQSKQHLDQFIETLRNYGSISDTYNIVPLYSNENGVEELFYLNEDILIFRLVLTYLKKQEALDLIEERNTEIANHTKSSCTIITLYAGEEIQIVGDNLINGKKLCKFSIPVKGLSVTKAQEMVMDRVIKIRELLGERYEVVFVPYKDYHTDFVVLDRPTSRH